MKGSVRTIWTPGTLSKVTSFRSDAQTDPRDNVQRKPTYRIGCRFGHWRPLADGRFQRPITDAAVIRTTAEEAAVAGTGEDANE